MLPKRRVKIVRPENLAPMAHQQEMPAAMREADFQVACEEVARSYGWTVYHETDSRKSPRGLPDLIMLSPLQPDGTVVLVMLELKTEKGTLSDDQEVWQMKLGAVDRLVTGVLRPSGWPHYLALCFDPATATAVE